MSKRSRHAFDQDLQTPPSQYAVYGTPLPAFDPEASDDGSYIPIWKQTVTDERGRKRLHGAFTGGFSAGYFNTVGSKEGWTPSNFVSSRQRGSSHTTSVSRPEDYMDEEDLAERAEAEHVRTMATFAGLGSSQSDQLRLTLNRNFEDTIGVRLLNKMGWRKGQGIGPMVRRKADLDDSVDNSEDVHAASHLFAPLNTPLVLLQKKSNSRGLGVEEAASQESLLPPPFIDGDGSDDDPWTAVRNRMDKSASTASTTKRRFGTATPDHLGSDDEDPYAMGPRISFSVTSARDHKSKKMTDFTKPRSSMRALRTPKKPNRGPRTSLQLCQDGKPPMAGFMLSSSAVQSAMTQFSSPQVPENWAPRALVQLPGSTSRLPSPAVTSDHASRARALGEKPLPGRSVFDFMSSGTRDRIVAVSGNTSLPPGRGEQNTSSLQALTTAGNDWSDFASLPVKEIADSALGRLSGGWSPYAIDQAKASRYQNFLEVCVGIRKPSLIGQSGMSKRDFINELREFSHAAQVFRPVTGMMASRFTAATGMNKTSSQAQGALDEPLLMTKRSTSRDAAMAGLYGPLTRSAHGFHPTRLLCKRFGLQLPAVCNDSTVEPPHDPRSSTHLITHAATGTNGSSPGVQTQERSTPSVELQQYQAVSADSNTALEAKRAGDEIFKAIFS